MKLTCKLKARCLPLARLVALYALLGFGAIYPAFAFDRQAVLDAREGLLRKLVVHSEAKEFKSVPVETIDGTKATLDDFEGRIVVLNFWATWCPPCVKEMPSLDRLQAEFDLEEVRVVAVATGRNPVEQVRSFLADHEIDNLEVLFDQKTRLSGAFGVFGLPVTSILDRDGREIARLSGDADWNSSSALQIVRLIADSD